MTPAPSAVIPAKAGIQSQRTALLRTRQNHYEIHRGVAVSRGSVWIPAFAGMTDEPWLVDRFAILQTPTVLVPASS